MMPRRANTSHDDWDELRRTQPISQAGAVVTPPLDRARILAGLEAAERARIDVEVLEAIDSTNAELLRRAAPHEGHTSVLLAERQTAGRGRRGRTWLAPAGQSLCLSLGRKLSSSTEDLGPLSLACGVAVLRALDDLGFESAKLKWPNDVLAGSGKLAGILAELRTDRVGAPFVVVGIGVNVALDQDARARIAAAGGDAADFLSLQARSGAVPSRDAIAARLISQGTRALDDFERAGLQPFLAEWSAADGLRSQPVTVHGVQDEVSGLARGIDTRGALLVETATGLRRFVSGEVTVRREA